MKGFTWCGDLNGSKNMIVDEYYVPDATAIEKGEPVRFTQGTGIVVLADPTNLQDRILGVSLLEKVASDGVTMLPVSISPTAKYTYKCNKAYTLTGGSTTTAVDSSLLPDTADVWIGGAIQIVTCAADSSLVGRIVKISDSATSGVLTLAETLPAALASGDTIYLCPGYMLKDYLLYSLSSDSMDIDYDQASTGSVVRIVSSDPDNMEMVVTFEASEPNT
jgi:hypothetical protein